ASSPSVRSACMAFALIWIPAPISSSCGACSYTSTSWPACSRKQAALRPPSPPPAIRILYRVMCPVCPSFAADISGKRDPDQAPPQRMRSCVLRLGFFLLQRIVDVAHLHQHEGDHGNRRREHEAGRSEDQFDRNEPEQNQRWRNGDEAPLDQRR